MNKRNEFERKFKDLQKEYDKMAPPTLDGRRAAIEDIKKTAEEAVDGLQSQFEGRKSLKKLREERVSARPKKTNPSI